MANDIENIKNNILKRIEESSNTEDIASIKSDVLGKSGSITELMNAIKDIPKEERALYGRNVNELKEVISSSLATKLELINKELYNKQLEEEKIDLTLPPRDINVGNKHILTKTEEEIIDALVSMGFIAVEGFELEDEYHNFEALNIPHYHPARDDHDSIYVSKDRLLRTHSSGMQIRIMEDYKPPLAIASPGKCSRSDDVDATHSPVFHQVEGFLIDKGVNFAHLKGCLLNFCRKMFGDDVEILLRPDYFPFVEPGAEINVSCVICKGKGCRICKNTGFIEILGAGMIHPKVFEHVGIDSEKYSGFAFGIGVDRVAMLRHQIPDIRMFFENDINFLGQF